MDMRVSLARPFSLTTTPRGAVQDFVFRQQAMKRTSRYFRQGCSFGDISVGFEQIAGQGFPFKLRDRMRLARHESNLRLERHHVLNMERKVLGIDHGRRRQDNRPFNDVFQFSKIARPGIVLQQRDRLRSNGIYFLVDLGSGPQQEIFRQKRDVLNSLA